MMNTQHDLTLGPVTHQGWIACRVLNDQGHQVLRPIPQTFSTVSRQVCESYAMRVCNIHTNKALHSHGIKVVVCSAAFSLPPNETDAGGL